MDYLAQHFIAFARRELQAIIERLSGIEKVLQRQVESKEKTDTATDKHQHSPTVLRAELEISHSEKYRDEAKAARELVRETWKLYVEIFTLLVVFGYTAVSAFQLSEMRKATKASIDVAGTTARALEENKRQFQDTLKQMKQQTVAQRISANTAKDTLHISERAYLTIDVGPPDYDQRSVNMLLTNTGHIPPTQVKTTVHEATVMRTPISLPNTSSPVEEMHWTEDVIDTLP